MKSSPKLYNFDALYENCKETFENPKGTPLQKKSKFRKKISVVCLNVEIPTGILQIDDVNWANDRKSGIAYSLDSYVKNDIYPADSAGMNDSHFKILSILLTSDDDYNKSLKH